MVQLVTVAKITLNRPGSIQRGGFQQTVGGFSNSKTVFVVLDGVEPGDILAKVKEIAVANGESALGAERLTVATPLGAPDGVICFNEQFDPRSTQFGELYAETEIFPAIQIEGRYFRLNEVSMSP